MSGGFRIVTDTLVRNRTLDVSTAIFCMSLISVEENVSHGAASRGGQAARAKSQQQRQQQDDARTTFPSSSITSGKFHFNLNSFLRALRSYVLVVLELHTLT